MIHNIEKGTSTRLGTKISYMSMLSHQKIYIPKSWFIKSDILSNLLIRHGFIATNQGFSIDQCRYIMHFLDNLPREFYRKLWEQLDCFVETNKSTKRYAIRSSGVLEDGKKSSFAGIYKSYLNQRKVSNMTNAVIDCWYNSFSFSVENYARIHKISHVFPCNILIQEMMPSKCGGVLFKSDSQYYISANYGLAMSVVEGNYTVDFYIVKGNNIQRKIGKKEFALIPAPKKENPMQGEKLLFPDNMSKIQVIANKYNNYENILSVQLPSDMAEKPCLEAEAIYSLIQLADKAANVVSLKDYDMEWCFTPNKQLVVLQIRPLTRSISNIQKIKKMDSDISIGLVEGVATGISYFIANEKDALNFPVGAILVTKKLDGFALHALHKAVGCIVQSESILSHSAILAREFNLPTVGVKNISIIPREKMLEINGYNGKIIEIADKDGLI